MRSPYVIDKLEYRLADVLNDLLAGDYNLRFLLDVTELVTILNGETMREVRNKAAHNEVLSCDEAHQMRPLAIGILEMV